MKGLKGHASRLTFYLLRLLEQFAQAVGQGATNQQGQASQNYGAAAGNAMQNAAAARASGYIGSANALAGGLGQAANAYSQQQMLDRILKSGNTPGYNPNTIYAGMSPGPWAS